MGYSTSRKTLEQWLPYLEPLKKGEETAWTLEGFNARSLSYKIREALSIVQRYPEEYPELSRFAPYYMIQIAGPNTVKASLKPGVSVGLDGSIAVQSISTAALARKAAATTISAVGELLGLQTALSLVEAWARKGGAPRLHAPQAGLSFSELSKLYYWGVKQDPTVLIFATPSGGVTLREITDCKPNEETLAWTPEDE